MILKSYSNYIFCAISAFSFNFKIIKLVQDHLILNELLIQLNHFWLEFMANRIAMIKMVLFKQLLLI